MRAMNSMCLLVLFWAFKSRVWAGPELLAARENITNQKMLFGKNIQYGTSAYILTIQFAKTKKK